MENNKVDINEILDQHAEIRAQRADEERELKQPRTIAEAEWLIKVWKNTHGRKRKTPATSISPSFIPASFIESPLTLA